MTSPVETISEKLDEEPLVSLSFSKNPTENLKYVYDNIGKEITKTMGQVPGDIVESCV
jgi:hypothetical protein